MADRVGGVGARRARRGSGNNVIGLTRASPHQPFDHLSDCRYFNCQFRILQFCQ